MKYNNLGNTGLFVSELCLGAMTFGGEGIWGSVGNLQVEQAQPIIGRALEAGINFIDTADVYSNGLSETIVGQSLRNLGVRREEVVIATKVNGPMETGPNDTGNSRGHILDGVKASLRRLQVDHIDLYQLHAFDTATPIEESLAALDLLVRQGHVRYVGVSNWAAWQMARALGHSERLNLARIASTQSYYSLVGRDLEREILPFVTAEKLGLLVWSPLSGGLLSGKFSRKPRESDGSRRENFSFPPVDMDLAYDVIDVLEVVAAEHEVSVARIALAWVLAQPAVSSVILGAKRLDQLEDNIAATGIVLTAADIERIDAVSRPKPEYPAYMQRPRDPAPAG